MPSRKALSSRALSSRALPDPQRRGLPDGLLDAPTKGLDLAETYCRELGAAMISASFPWLVDRVAVGLVGPGSECYGFKELEMFLAVPSVAKKECQQHPEAFKFHRRLQFSIWSFDTLSSYREDLSRGLQAGDNLMPLTYARMQGALPSRNAPP